MIKYLVITGVMLRKLHFAGEGCAIHHVRCRHAASVRGLRGGPARGYAIGRFQWSIGEDKLDEFHRATFFCREIQQLGLGRTQLRMRETTCCWVACRHSALWGLLRWCFGGVPGCRWKPQGTRWRKSTSRRSIERVSLSRAQCWSRVARFGEDPTCEESTWPGVHILMLCGINK